MILLVCYVVLSLFSLLLLPVRQIIKDLWFFGFPDGFFYLFIGPLYGMYIPVTAVIQIDAFCSLGYSNFLFMLLDVEFYKSSFHRALFSGLFFVRS